MWTPPPPSPFRPSELCDDIQHAITALIYIFLKVKESCYSIASDNDLISYGLSRFSDLEDLCLKWYLRWKLYPFFRGSSNHKQPKLTNKTMSEPVRTHQRVGLETIYTPSYFLGLRMQLWFLIFLQLRNLSNLNIYGRSFVRLRELWHSPQQILISVILASIWSQLPL